MMISADRGEVMFVRCLSTAMVHLGRLGHAVCSSPAVFSRRALVSTLRHNLIPNDPPPPPPTPKIEIQRPRIRSTKAALTIVSLLWLNNALMPTCCRHPLLLHDCTLC